MVAIPVGKLYTTPGLTRAERIRQEDDEFNVYGRPLLRRWVMMGVEHAVSSHRTRRTRARATTMGKWLCDQKVQSFLEAYGIALADFLDIRAEITRTGPDTAVAHSIVRCGRKVGAGAPYHWEVRVYGMFPKGDLTRRAAVVHTPGTSV